MPTCINLKGRFGGKYRIGHDESAEHERGGFNDPWLLTIPARFGDFFPWGGDRIGLATSNRGPTARAISRLPFVRIEQDAEDGITVSFPVEHFSEVAQLAKPRRKRVLSPEQKAAAVERLAKFQFSPARTASKIERIPA